MFIKLGENIEITRIENADSCIPEVSQDVLDNFRRTATGLKKIAPRAEDFLYFSAVMMHAAEASGLNEDGTPKLNSRGEIVHVGWDKSEDTWKWSTNDPSIRPYKNSNGDIFPEEELIKAYKKWVHKPLCIDHKSSSVDHVRGFIVDTYYDRNLKRVIALCALDKHNYPDLARKVATGYSHSVSMGTAVGKAICSDCARVARAEHDFCDHMRKKTCYGEINVDLNPIELSIVVNGADPKAHIKHIIAAANTLNTYVDNKSKELKKIAETVFNANISLSDKKGLEYGGAASYTIQTTDLKEFRDELDTIYKRVEEFVNSAESSTEDNENSEEKVSEKDEQDADSLAPPHERLAANNISELHKITSAIENKLDIMKKSLNKLENAFINTQEENMSGSKEMNKRGYYQGAGGVNEPSPGQAKYPKDAVNEKLRVDGDKHMTGQMDTGPVDGMHPGVESSGMSELERKKMLARAESEERAMRRTAIVDMAKKALEDKKAYFQGGGGANEPTPGKVKYPSDKTQYDLREDGDKHMLGQKPFPGVGNVEGLHPSPGSADISDELKRKEMLRRASLRARFIKAANPDGTQNFGKSSWEVFSGENLLITASVEELSGGNTGILYDSIATKEFGSKLIEKVKSYGAEGLRSLVKKAQDAAPAPDMSAAPAPAPAPDMGAAPAPAPAPAAGGEADTGASGDPKDNAMALSEKLRDLSSDMVEAVRSLTGEQAEMGAMEESAPEGAGQTATASSKFSLTSLSSLRRELNGSLIEAMKECVAELKSHDHELRMIGKMYDSGRVNASNEEFIESIVEDAVDEAKTAMADGFKLMTAFVKYAKGTKAMTKKAQGLIDTHMTVKPHDSMDLGDMSYEPGLYDDFEEGDELSELINEDSDHESDDEDLDHESDDKDLDEESDEEDSNDEDEELSDMDDAHDILSGDVNNVTVDLSPEAMKNLIEHQKASVNSKAGRAALRAKLAADAIGKMDNGEVHDMSRPDFSDMLDQAHKLSDGDIDLDVKPSGDLGRFKTIEEKNESMMDLAKAPPKVRKEAEAIHKLVSEGKLDVGDLDALISEGLDKDAVAYYKKYYGQTDGGSEFASELVKEHVKAQLEEDLNLYRVKMARAYELTYDMVDRGLCGSDRSAISAQVDEIMKFNDESFNSLKRVVAKHSPTMKKEASRIPQVGIIGSGETSAAKDDWSELSSAFGRPTKRMF